MQWQNEAFTDEKSLYDGERLDGYCLLCNKLTRVRLRTWFLCDICHRVAGAIGRNHVAELGIVTFWNEQVKSNHRNWQLERLDVSSLRPRRDTDESGTAPIDFLVRDTQTGKHVFGIENKTGRSSIKDMSNFQLDLSDCDTIANDMERLKAPAYIIHAQVMEVWKPPTMGFHLVGLWWTDVYRMAEHFKSVKQRRDENRGAAYFGKKAFEEIGTLEKDISSDRLLKQYKRQKPGPMYKTS